MHGGPPVIIGVVMTRNGEMEKVAGRTLRPVSFFMMAVVW
jgi:hypothetical protein